MTPDAAKAAPHPKVEGGQRRARDPGMCLGSLGVPEDDPEFEAYLRRRREEDAKRRADIRVIQAVLGTLLAVVLIREGCENYRANNRPTTPITYAP